jgi:catechol 2,3-dioxygenase-like lactoylglutathione lyase family enzyme
MSTKKASKKEETKSTSVADPDMKLEVVVIPVSDVDRAKQFYTRLGWRLDADCAAGDNSRLVQFTPPGSGSSIQFGVNLTPVFHCETGTACRFSRIGARVTGPHPECLSYYTFVSLGDPDGNGWLLQEVTKRLAGRVAGNTTYASAHDLAQAMIRAAKAHEQHEKRTGQSDANWPYWHAEYMVREQSGEELPQINNHEGGTRIFRRPPNYDRPTGYRDDTLDQVSRDPAEREKAGAESEELEVEVFSFAFARNGCFSAEKRGQNETLC